MCSDLGPREDQSDCRRRQHNLRRDVELSGPRPHVLLLLPGRGRSGLPEISLVEEISHLDANGPVHGRLRSLSGAPDTPHLWVLPGGEPRDHVQRLSLLVPLPCFLPRQIHQ